MTHASKPNWDQIDHEDVTPPPTRDQVWGVIACQVGRRVPLSEVTPTTDDIIDALTECGYLRARD